MSRSETVSEPVTGIFFERNAGRADPAHAYGRNRGQRHENHPEVFLASEETRPVDTGDNRKSDSDNCKLAPRQPEQDPGLIPRDLAVDLHLKSHVRPQSDFYLGKQRGCGDDHSAADELPNP